MKSETELALEAEEFYRMKKKLEEIARWPLGEQG
jgi:hypothetical protein